MKLYYSPGACSLAAHILLNEINADYELEKVDIRTHLTEKGSDYYQINPKGYVPALEIDPKLVLTENIAILPFIAQNDPSQNLIPISGLGLAKVLEWLGYLNSELHTAYSALFAKDISSEQRKDAHKNIDKLLGFIEAHLKNSDTDYLLGDSFGPADAYLFVITNWSQLTHHDLSAFSHILALRSRVAERPSVQVAMKKEGLL